MAYLSLIGNLQFIEKDERHTVAKCSSVAKYTSWCLINIREEIGIYWRIRY